MMDKRSSYLFWGFILLVIVVAGWGYRAFFIERDFVVYSTTACNPQTEICFVWCEDDVCEEDYYKKIVKNAKNIPLCYEAVEECEPLACEPEETGCEIISCSSDSVEEGEECTNPLNFMTETENVDRETENSM